MKRESKRKRFPFRPCRLRLGQEGQGLVEFAVALPVLLVVVFGIMEFGVMFMDQIKLDNVAREGARAGAVPPSATDATRTTRATNAVTTTAAGLTSCTLQPTTVTFAQGLQGVSTEITVQVSCPYRPITPVGSLVSYLGRTLNFPANLSATSSQYIY